MENIASPLSSLRCLNDSMKREEKKSGNGAFRALPPANKKTEVWSPDPPLPITQTPSAQFARSGWVLRTTILFQAPHMIRDRKFHLRTFRRCLVGTEMVDWIIQQSGSFFHIHSRSQASGMWQALLEEGVIFHVTQEHQFKDKYNFYRFRDDQEGIGTAPSTKDRHQAESELQETFSLLLQQAPDAILRMTLRKPPSDRTAEDLELIYDELLHIKALSHLSNSVKRELASVLYFESHAMAGTVLFHQGDEGKSWYIILKGCVNVVIYGKGEVCTLQEGDDFGKLALVNDAPRAATIVTREDNCHFLRVDKDDFNRILRDVEANTVRLKEHGQDVLLLQKIASDGRVAEGAHSHYKYTVIAGTPQKMLEHLLETRVDSRLEETGEPSSQDNFLEDFLLTHIMFMPNHQLCSELKKHYNIDVTNSRQETEFIIASKRRVAHFVQTWATTIREQFYEDPVISRFIQDLQIAIVHDSKHYKSLEEEVKTMTNMVDTKQKLQEEYDNNSSQRWKVSAFGHIVRMIPGGSEEEDKPTTRRPIKDWDEIIFRVHCADHTYTTLKTVVGATSETIKGFAADKLGLKDDLVLVEVKSSGERIVFKDFEVSVPTGLSINGRIFLSPTDHLDALTPLPEQEGPSEGTGNTLETLNSNELAYQMAMYDWELFSSVHEYELIYQVFERHQFRKTMSNLDVFLRRFNEVQFWVVTEMCLTTSLSRRVQLLRKFIKVACHCREYQDLNAFFAIVMGLSNIAVSRLSQTWERLPGKIKKVFSEFETLIDPSRNHRRYRQFVSKLESPIIPFMPLLLKDMTFTHEGNKTYLEGLVNFEKMHMIAQTLRTLRNCRSRPLVIEAPPSGKSAHEVRKYIRNFCLIDNQRRLTQLSNNLEPRRP
ncbi:rap guanine nucleotide exchange factor 4-like [Limulus polyphemus]|uniref:Rap guanine nucleotide exchange factor 4-like n=1 Tax=Limulus polyphemus TaxID=6850 RepID=A0ABM1S9V6_LIMPO|nr:rap guanine nucleotide exchange factor 4-like [Limulus polyphemus]XP_022240411.1 rap guanine nucleotide exchange factor 4-like [Limulus polyphemus]